MELCGSTVRCFGDGQRNDYACREENILRLSEIDDLVMHDTRDMREFPELCAISFHSQVIRVSFAIGVCGRRQAYSPPKKVSQLQLQRSAAIHSFSPVSTIFCTIVKLKFRLMTHK